MQLWGTSHSSWFVYKTVWFVVLEATLKVVWELEVTNFIFFPIQRKKSETLSWGSRVKFLAWETLRNCSVTTTLLCQMKGVFFMQCFETRILEISRVNTDVSWMKEDLVITLASVTRLAEHSVIVAWIST